MGRDRDGSVVKSTGTFPEALSSVSSTHAAWLTTAYNSTSWGFHTLRSTALLCVRTHTHTIVKTIKK